MNTGISSSYPSTHSVSDNLAVMPQSIGEEENSIISWYHNIGDNNGNNENNEEDRTSLNNSEDFIDIDMLPETLEGAVKVPGGLSVDPERVSLCLGNFKEIYFTHRKIFRNDSCHLINRNIKEEDRSSSHKSKAEFAKSFANTMNICCYNEGLVALLQIFGRIDCLMQQYSVTINDCRCTKNHTRGYISQIRYALETGGDKCQQCSMDHILHNLNSKLLANVATTQFFTVKEIIDSIVIEEEMELGATSSGFSCQQNDNPETGWLRKWLRKYVDQEAVVVIIYCEMVESPVHRNKVNFRIVDYYTDEYFHLTIPMESVYDKELERRLLQEEKVFVLRTEMLSYKHRPEEFESLLYHPNERFHDMNVLGQIVRMFREQTVENFRDVSRPKGDNRIKVPNMHRHGVLVALPLSATLPSR